MGYAGTVYQKKVKERYGMIALTGNSDYCCVPGECCGDNGQPSAMESTKLIGYDAKDIESIPEASVLGAGCGRLQSLRESNKGR